MRVHPGLAMNASPANHIEEWKRYELEKTESRHRDRNKLVKWVREVKDRNENRNNDRKNKRDSKRRWQKDEDWDEDDNVRVWRSKTISQNT